MNTRTQKRNDWLVLTVHPAMHLILFSNLPLHCFKRAKRGCSRSLSIVSQFQIKGLEKWEVCNETAVDFCVRPSTRFPRFFAFLLVQFFSQQMFWLARAKWRKRCSELLCTSISMVPLTLNDWIFWCSLSITVHQFYLRMCCRFEWTIRGRDLLGWIGCSALLRSM